MAKEKKPSTWRKPRKIEHLETAEYKYYIFCEGEKTEPNYFNKFKKYISDNSIYKDLVSIEILPCATDTLRVLERAISYVQEHKINKGHVWCVYDKDDFPPVNFNAVVNKIQSINSCADKLFYHAAWSNQCIEYWFILHFSYYTSNNNRKDYIKFLNAEFKKLNIGKYKKNMDNIFNILIEHGNPKTAINHAKRIICQSPTNSPSNIAPGTKVYELVEELAKFFPEDLKQKFI